MKVLQQAWHQAHADMPVIASYKPAFIDLKEIFLTLKPISSKSAESVSTPEFV